MPEHPGHFYRDFLSTPFECYDADALLLDLDSHLFEYNGSVFSAPVDARIHTLKQLGFIIVLGTNNPEDRTHLAQDGTFYVSRTRTQLARGKGKPHISFYDEVCDVTGIGPKRFVSSGDNWLRDSRGALLAGMQAVTTDRVGWDPMFEWFLRTRWRETTALVEHYQIVRLDGHTLYVPEQYNPDFRPVGEQAH